MSKQHITTINGVNIFAESTEQGIFIPIKPICEALGIDDSAQKQRIHRHYILSSTEVTLTSVAADGKAREMTCLPLEYVYGWLFTIDANLVSEAVRERVADYQRECYDALYGHFAGRARRAEQHARLEAEMLRRKAALNENIKEQKAEIKEIDARLDLLARERTDGRANLFEAQSID